MSPDEFLQGEDFEVTSADEFLSGEDFSIDNEESDYAPIPKKKGFYKSYSDALRGLGTGLVKGAASTLGTVPRNITKVVTNATDISIRKKLTDQAERINEINDRLIDQMRQTTDPLKKEKIKKLIQGNIDTLNMLNTTGADISAEIEGFASGFEEGALELVSPDNT